VITRLALLLLLVASPLLAGELRSRPKCFRWADVGEWRSVRDDLATQRLRWADLLLP